MKAPLVLHFELEHCVSSAKIWDLGGSSGGAQITHNTGGLCTVWAFTECDGYGEKGLFPGLKKRIRIRHAIEVLGSIPEVLT